MPDLDQIKQEKQGARDPGGRFVKGRSGNPAGRPRGCRDHINRAARLLLAGEGEALTRKAVSWRSPATRRLHGYASNGSSGRIAIAPSNSRCRRSATPPI